jgi:hypothetical protein
MVGLSVLQGVEDGTAGEGTWSFDGVDAGRLACYEFTGSPWFAWTHDELLILVRGWRGDADWAAMYEDWTAAGPS